MKKLVLVATLGAMTVGSVSAADWRDYVKNAKDVATGAISKITNKSSKTETAEPAVETTPAVVTEPVIAPPAPIIEVLPPPIVQAPIFNIWDIECKVVGVSDGDTFTCLDDSNTQIKVRMNQIDAPESGQDFGKVAKQTLSDYIYGQRVGLSVSGADKYSRTLAEVYRLSDEQNINKLMVRDGMAWAYQEYLTDYEYTSLESAARSSGVGLWAHPNPVYPSAWRSSAKTTSNATATPKQSPAPKKTATKSNQVVKQPNNGAGRCGVKKTCGQMSSCAEARYFLNTCGLSKLDNDGDGTPCESLCR